MNPDETDLAPKTRREVLIARRAFIGGAREVVSESRMLSLLGGGTSLVLPAKLNEEQLCDLAAHRYPLPKVTRAREETDPHVVYVRWRFSDGVLMVSVSGREWKRPIECPLSFAPTPERVALWHDLYTNPTETVEDDTP